MATDPSFKPGAMAQKQRIPARRKQMRRWCQALKDRHAPGHLSFRPDHDAFHELTRLKTDQELMETLKGENVSQAVKDLFARVFRERAKALEMKGKEDPDVFVEDWWGTGPEMLQPGGGVFGDMETEKTEGAGTAEEGKVETGVEDGQRMDVADGEAVGGFGMQLPLR